MDDFVHDAVVANLVIAAECWANNNMTMAEKVCAITWEMLLPDEDFIDIDEEVDR